MQYSYALMVPSGLTFAYTVLLYHLILCSYGRRVGCWKYTLQGVVEEGRCVSSHVISSGVHCQFQCYINGSDISSHVSHVNWSSTLVRAGTGAGTGGITKG